MGPPERGPDPALVRSSKRMDWQPLSSIVIAAMLKIHAIQSTLQQRCYVVNLDATADSPRLTLADEYSDYHIITPS